MCCRTFSNLSLPNYLMIHDLYQFLENNPKIKNIRFMKHAKPFLRTPKSTHYIILEWSIDFGGNKQLTAWQNEIKIMSKKST